MASGPVHATVTIAATVPTFAAAAWLTRDPGLAALAAAGCIAGIVLSPDLDVDHLTVSETVLWRITPVIGLPWSVAWIGYAYLLPHRHPLSHWPVLGTLGRLLYALLLLLTMQIHLRALGIPFDALFWTRWPRASLAWACGLAVADFLHWCMDGFP